MGGANIYQQAGRYCRSAEELPVDQEKKINEFRTGSYTTYMTI